MQNYLRFAVFRLVVFFAVDFFATLRLVVFFAGDFFATLRLVVFFAVDFLAVFFFAAIFLKEKDATNRRPIRAKKFLARMRSPCIITRNYFLCAQKNNLCG